MRLIDADAVLERIERDCDARCPYKDYKEPVRSKMCKSCELGDARVYVEDAPTVDAEPIQYGQWIRVKIPQTPPYELNIHKCSECNTYFYESINRHRYCPNCGAKMDEVKEDEIN